MADLSRNPGIELQRRLVSLAAGTLACGLLAGAPNAHAHINMTGALMSRGGDQKNFPCDGKRGDGPVYTFEPGSTITLSVNEQIPHPGYFRIAFDNDGEDGFVEPKSIKPVDPNRRCPFDANDKCGESDFCNVVSSTGATVLWDNIEPHLAGSIKTYTWNVKLPDVECENCVIQVLQIMEDTVHGAYCPTGSCTDASLEDIYHRCIDIKLVKGATNSPGTTTNPVATKGMQCAATSGAAGSGASGAGGAAGASAGGGGTGTAGTAASAGTSGGTAGAPVAGASTAGAAAPNAGAMAVAGTGATPTGAAGARAGSPAASGTGGTGTGTTSGAVTGAGTGPTPPAVAGAGGTAAATPAPSGSDGGCSVAARHREPHAMGWVLLAVGVVFVSRRRRVS